MQNKKRRPFRGLLAGTRFSRLTNRKNLHIRYRRRFARWLMNRPNHHSRSDPTFGSPPFF